MALTDDACERLRQAHALAEACPMPPDLKAAIADQIEPHTMNAEIDHDVGLLDVQVRIGR
jgi:hypothetical protein